MKKIITFIFLLSFVFTIGCSDNTNQNVSESAPEKLSLARIENFEGDTKEVVLVYGKRVDKLEELSEEENVRINDYISKYKDNPRLNDDHKSLFNNFKTMDTFYPIYFKNKDKDDSTSISLSNNAIKICFTMLEIFELKEFQIK